MKTGLEIWKFGGAALADARAIQKAAERIAEHQGPLVVVASALSGVTDLLLAAAPDAAETFKRKHQQAARSLLSGPPLQRYLDEVDASARAYDDVRSAIAILGHQSARAQDTLIARGEQMSARLLAALLTKSRCRASYVDALDIVRTDDVHGGATPRLEETGTRARKRLRPLIEAGTGPVVPGFLGR